MEAAIIICALGGGLWRGFCRLAQVSENVTQGVTGLWLLLWLCVCISILAH
ncbi:MAG: hypothetical protein NTY53_05060 [Kiritimatiellaeota bacterium]|nr:hypothetical protein [Kiritimatiellota bacterium]